MQADWAGRLGRKTRETDKGRSGRVGRGDVSLHQKRGRARNYRQYTESVPSTSRRPIISMQVWQRSQHAARRGSNCT